MPADPWIFVDDVNAFVSSGGRFCYYVVTHEAANPAGIDASSASNIACTAQQDLIYIPNCVILGSGIAENATFKPIMGFVDVQEYQFLIINRWGQVIWETTDPDDAWDGRIGSQGIQVQIGVYAYYVAVRSGTTKRVEKRGTVTVLTAQE